MFHINTNTLPAALPQAHSPLHSPPPTPHTQVELYNHIEAEEMKKVECEVQVKRAWLTEKLQAQDQLPKSANPAVTIGQIETEKRVRKKYGIPQLGKGDS